MNELKVEYYYISPNITIGGEEPDRPGEGQVSKYDTRFVYDGKGHTINTNALAALRLDGGEKLMVRYALTKTGAWFDVAPAWTNAGTYSVWYKLSATGYDDYVHEARVVIEERAITITSPTKTKTYDGTVLTFGADEIEVENLVNGEGLVFGNFASRTDTGTIEAAFDYGADENTLLGNYSVSVNTGTLTVAEAGSPFASGQVPDEPGEGMMSEFDYVGVYDGVGRTIDTNALVRAVRKVAIAGAEWEISYWSPRVGNSRSQLGAGAESEETRITNALSQLGEDSWTDGDARSVAPIDAEWGEVAPCWTNAGEYVVWYKVSAANCADYVHEARVVIEPRPVTLTSPTKTKTYDGTALTFGANEIVVENLVNGEGLVFSGFASRTDTGTVAAAFDYGADENTLLDNYSVTVNTGTLTVTEAGSPFAGGQVPDVPGEGMVSAFDYVGVYDGEGHTIDTNALVTAVRKIAIGDVVVKFICHTDWLAANAARGEGDIPAGDDSMWNVVAPCWTNAGSYVVWYKVSAANCADYVHEAKVVIEKKPLAETMVGDVTDVVYNGAAWQPEVTVTDGEPSIITASDYTVTYAGNVDVGTASVTIRATDEGNYSGEVVKTFRILPKGMTGSGFAGTLAETAFVYDGTAHTPAVSVTDGAAALVEGRDFTVAYENNIDAGTGCAVVTGTGNYAGEMRLEFEIAKRPIMLTATSKDKPYDGFPLAVTAGDITASGSGYAPNECFTYGGFASITDVGETAATFTYSDSATAKVANYAVTVVGGKTLTVTVGTDQISVTAASGSWEYDGAAHTLAEYEVENADVLRSGDELEVTFDAASCVTTPDDGAVENRIVAVRVLRGGTEDVTRNYSLATYPGTLRVANARIDFDALGIDAAAFSTEAVYDGAGHTVAMTVPELLTGPATVLFAAEADGTWGDTPPAFTNAGTYTTHYAIGGKYYDTLLGTATVTITPREVTLCSAGATKVYDGTPLRAERVTVKEGSLGFATGDTFTAGSFASITDVGGTENAFDYTLTGNSLAGNYIIHKEFGWLRVTPAEMNLENVARSYADVYDGAGHGIEVVSGLPGAVVTYALVAGDESAYTAFNPVWTNATAGAMTVYFKIMAPNHNPGYGSATVEIAKRAVTVTSRDVGKEYDGTALSLTAADIAADNLVSGESFAYGGFASRTEAGQTSATFTIAAGDGTKLENYVITPVYGTITIAKAESPFVGGQEPDVPGVGMVSAFDYRGVYDGEGHTIDTNALVAAAKAIALPSVELTISYWMPRVENALSQLEEPTVDAVWSVEPPMFTNVCATSVWYKVSAENCEDYVHESRVVITKKPLEAEMVGDVADVVYNGAAWIPEVSVTDKETAESPSIITAEDYAVSYLDNTSAGTAKVVVTATKDGNYSGEVVKTFAIGKIKVAPPEIGSKVYNGERQTADVAETEYYRVASNSGGTGAGTYTVFLMLKDTKNYAWTTVETGYVLLDFVIKKAENIWTEEPAINGWKEGTAASVPQGAARFGEVSVLYSGEANNGTRYENALQVANAGSYRAVFTVAESPNYNGLRREVPFVISASTDANDPFSFRVVNYLGVYDGKPHTIQVITTGGDGSFTVEYSATGEAPWLVEAPTYTEPCSTQVWYRITSPNYAPVHGSGTVSISPAAGGTGEDGVTVTPPDAAAFVIPDSWFAEYPAFESLYGADRNAAVMKATGKRDAAGNEMKVWHDYVAGTDPTKLDSWLRAGIVLEDGVPVVDWKPALNGERVRDGVRRYRVFGKARLEDAKWDGVPTGKEGD